VEDPTKELCDDESTHVRNVARRDVSNRRTQPKAFAKGTPVRNIVLVHGLFADGSSWGKVIPILQRHDLNVTAVQNPLTSFQDDVDATKRVLALQEGPTVLAAHSFGGMVISEAGVDLT